MRFFQRLRRITETAGCLLREPGRSAYYVFRLPEALAASRFCDKWNPETLPPPALGPGRDDQPNPLRTYFDSVTEGPGIWKWTHYFDIYHHHFAKFREHEAHVVEVGIYSGGSLLMWKHYFGPNARITGIDIEPACKAYEEEQISIYIGDQADREFWKKFRASTPPIDVFIDDGGHSAEQQIVTLEEVLPHLRPGGVYLCEDIHGVGQQFATYAYSLAEHLNEWVSLPKDGQHASGVTAFQAGNWSFHLYPFVVVIKRGEIGIERLVAPKNGTQWQPFL